MSEWLYTTISKDFLVCYYDTSVLIQAPHNSMYDGYVFWFPAKLVREERKHTITIIHKKDFVFRLKKYGKGKYNRREVLDEKEIGTEIFYEMFQNAIYIPENKPKIHIPKKLEINKVEVIDELKDE